MLVQTPTAHLQANPSSLYSLIQKAKVPINIMAYYGFLLTAVSNGIITNYLLMRLS